MNNKISVIFSTGDSNVKLYTSIIEENVKKNMINVNTTASEKANMLLELFVGSRNTRQGPQPTIEQKAAILKIIKIHIHLDKPISVLIPSGPKKTRDGEGIDLAELNVLKGLQCLQEAAKSIYKHGFQFIFRMEDATAYILEGKEKVKTSVEQYITQFRDLIKVLNMHEYTSIFTEIGALKEQALTYADFERVSLGNAQVMENYLLASAGCPESEWSNLHEYKTLIAIGWRGLIPSEMRQHYFAKYNRLFPDNTLKQQMVKLSEYFGVAIARKSFDISGSHLWEHGNLEIGYAIPAPGVPEGIDSTRVYYRSVTMKQSKHNIPFWRAKGVHKISESNKIRCSLLSWTNIDETIHLGSLTLKRDDLSVTIKADTIFV